MPVPCVWGSLNVGAEIFAEGVAAQGVASAPSLGSTRMVPRVSVRLVAARQVEWELMWPKASASQKLVVSNGVASEWIRCRYDLGGIGTVDEITTGFL